jgi:formylglycine-generating enzyme required for sulfatase activity
MQYASWLSDRTRQPWRLPSEAEWEKAARWDAATGAARIYPWGNTFDVKRCNTLESGKWTTSRVGNFPSGASPYGCLDMTGNIWEWTSTHYRTYPYTESNGRGTSESAEKREVRGGAWDNYARVARAACRISRTADFTKNTYGFRLAQSTA